MTISLSNLKKPKQSRKRRRVGRGDASGVGSYSGRGLKGQRSRSGGRTGLTRMSIKEKLKVFPKKRGFKSIYGKMANVNLEDLNKHFKDGDQVTLKKLVEKKLVSYNPLGLKILGQGKLTKKLKVEARGFSKKAKEAIVKMGGKIKEV